MRQPNSVTHDSRLAWNTARQGLSQQRSPDKHARGRTGNQTAGSSEGSPLEVVKARKRGAAPTRPRSRNQTKSSLAMGSPAWVGLHGLTLQRNLLAMGSPARVGLHGLTVQRNLLAMGSPAWVGLHGLMDAGPRLDAVQPSRLATGSPVRVGLHGLNVVRAQGVLGVVRRHGWPTPASAGCLCGGRLRWQAEQL